MLVLPQVSLAQTSAADTVSGRVTADSSNPVSALVTITRGPDRLTLRDSTDAAGAYRIVFDTGTGDYLVHVAAVGYRAARRRVQRNAGEHRLVANFHLTPDVTQLTPVKVVAQRPARITNDVGPAQVEVGAFESWHGGVNGQVSPESEGDLSAVAATIPGVTVTPTGVGVLGATETNITNLNGVALSASALPRAARAEIRVSSTTFDATRGGFSGANIDVRLGPGNRLFQSRRAFLTLGLPHLQSADPRVQSSGGITSIRASVGADGELIRKALTYNVALDVNSTTGAPLTLLSANGTAFGRLGIAADSIAPLIASARRLAIPVASTAKLSSLRRDLTWLGRLDDTRDSLRVRSLTTYATLSRLGSLDVGPLATPSTGLEEEQTRLGVSLLVGNYLGAGHQALTESRLAVSGFNERALPYVVAPSATVVVGGSIAERNGAALVSLGGNTAPITRRRGWTFEAANETVWRALGSRHRFKTLAWARGDGARMTLASGQLGAFSYNSVADLAANRPVSFVRSSGLLEAGATVWNAATAFSHQYAPTRALSLLYGARIETDWFGSLPTPNPVLESALGFTARPERVRYHVSPRLGFSYTYNGQATNRISTNYNPVGRFFRLPTGVISGGIGDFRALLSPSLLELARAHSGLSPAEATLTCVGPSVPAPDWALMAADPSAVPSACADGSIFSQRAPAVTLIAPSFDVPHSWRASLNWTTTVPKAVLRISGLATYDLAQPSMVDLNFLGRTSFALTSESGRPVFVPASSIDTSSGMAASGASRRSSAFDAVNALHSDLRGYGGQLQVNVTPDFRSLRRRFHFQSSVGYSLQLTRRQFRGFDGQSSTDPRTVEWAPSPFDARHVMVVTAGVATRHLGALTLSTRAQSGLPFTAVVLGDIDGDGRAGDRAYVPDPETEPDLRLRQQMATLLATTPTSGRECLLQNAGRVAPRNGCRGPWTVTVNARWQPPIPKRWGTRLEPSLYFQNILAGADQLLHGQDQLRGWGSLRTPDPVLLLARGFDVSQKRYRYDVNPGFAHTNLRQSSLRAPFRLVIDVSMELSVDQDLQVLRRALEPKRDHSRWVPRSAEDIARFYLGQTSNIHQYLLAQSDSLLLTAEQIAALQRADEVYADSVRSLFTGLGRHLASNRQKASAADLEAAAAAQRRYRQLFWRQPAVAVEILTPLQRQLMPFLGALVLAPPRAREEEDVSVGYPVSLRTGSLH